MKKSEKNLSAIVEGKKVYLRYPELDDFVEFSMNARKSSKFHRNLVNPPKTIEDFSNWLEQNSAATNENFLICDLETDEICGAVNLSQIFRKAFQNAYLGYYLFEKFTARGLMTEAVDLVLKFAFRGLKLHRIEANVQPENLASIAVLKRCGFTKEGFSRNYLKIGGRWRDHERWAIVREDWSSNK